MPITCVGPCQPRDILFYVLYGMNPDYIQRLVEESVINIGREFVGKESVLEALQLLRPCEDDSIQRLQIKFLVLLNEDAVMRKCIANAKSHVTTGLCPFKAERFYDALADDLIPAWVRSTDLKHDEFLDTVRNCYLCS